MLKLGACYWLVKSASSGLYVMSTLLGVRHWMRNVKIIPLHDDETLTAYHSKLNNKNYIFVENNIKFCNFHPQRNKYNLKFIAKKIFRLDWKIHLQKQVLSFINYHLTVLDLNWFKTQLFYEIIYNLTYNIELHTIRLNFESLRKGGDLKVYIFFMRKEIHEECKQFLFTNKWLVINRYFRDENSLQKPQNLFN